MWFAKPLTGASLAAGTLSLTFDDGPGESREATGPKTLELARYLSEEGIAATFFVVGRHVQEQPGIVERLRGLGHVVGSHTYSHPHLTETAVPDETAFKEVIRARNLIGPARLTEPLFFRPPYGGWNPRLAHLLNADPATCIDHLGPVGWDVCADDFAYWRDGRSPESCAKAYERKIEGLGKHGGIVLFHDRTADDAAISSKNRTFELIRILIPELRARGVRFVPLAGVPAIGNAQGAATGFVLRAANGRRLGRMALRREGGFLRMENAAGREFWNGLDALALPGQQIAFRGADGRFLRNRGEQMEWTDRLEHDAVFEWTYVN